MSTGGAGGLADQGVLTVVRRGDGCGQSDALAGCGGVAEAVLGGFTTTVYAAARHWDAVVPVPVLLAAAGVALLVGAVAGLYPALRAARLVPAEALRL